MVYCGLIETPAIMLPEPAPCGSRSPSAAVSARSPRCSAAGSRHRAPARANGPSGRRRPDSRIGGTRELGDPATQTRGIERQRHLHRRIFGEAISQHCEGARDQDRGSAGISSITLTEGILIFCHIPDVRASLPDMAFARLRVMLFVI